MVLKVLDPIDGTKGFLKGDDALYVVQLSVYLFLFVSMNGRSSS